MDLQWIYDGSTMDLQWIYDGSTMDPQWIYNGSTMDLQWIYDGSTMDLRWIYDGSTMDLPRMTQNQIPKRNWQFSIEIIIFQGQFSTFSAFSIDANKHKPIQSGIGTCCGSDHNWETSLFGMEIHLFMKPIISLYE